MKIATWNVRTLLDRDGSVLPERRTAIVSKELARYNIDIAALSETRLSDEDQLTEIGGYTYFWKGKPNGIKREGGVGFAIRSELLSQMEQPHGISDRIMCLRLPLPCGRFASVISVYAPTLGSDDDVIMAFYLALRNCLSGVPNADKILLLGDFNARVGCDHYTWDVLGRYGLGKANDNGIHLLQICTEFGLAIGNTYFYQKPIHKVTWTHPRSKHGHILDYVITRKRDLQDLCTVRVLRGAECGSDHNLVRAKFKLRIRKKVRMSGVKVPKRLDVSKLKCEAVRKSLQEKLNETHFDGTWEQFKTTVYDTGLAVVGTKENKHRDWFDENNVLINNLIEEKRKSHEKLLGSSSSSLESAKEDFKKAKSKLQCELRQIKNTWWADLSAEIQQDFDKKDSKAFFSKIKKAYGPQPPSVVPLKSKDGFVLFKDVEGIVSRWQEHFADLFDNPSEIDEDVMNNLTQYPVMEEMMVEPTSEELNSSMARINTGKAPGFDGIPIELITLGGENVSSQVHKHILSVWRGNDVAQDWVNAIMLPLYKGKGQKSECGNHRGITLLGSVGKILARILLDRLQKYVCPNILPESQSGFREGRGTVDMIFSARQLMEKCKEQRVPLYQVFVDLTKAFDTVNRDALWIVLGKLGCPQQFVVMLKKLHQNMKARVNVNGVLSDPVSVDNGVKQGDIPAPTLFSIYFATMLVFAFGNCDIGISLRFRTSGKLFNLRRLDAKSKTFQTIIRELLYADDADLVAHSQEDIQRIMNLFSSACKAFGLTISLKKTVVMYSPPPGVPYLEPNIFVDGKRLKVVDSFEYLGSVLSRDGTLDAEIRHRISQASSAFGKLETRVWNDRGLTVKTKISVYEACVLTCLLYAAEAWTTYRRHLKVLERFHQKCLRRILNIRWQSLTPDTVVLEHSNNSSLETKIMKIQMRWAGHLVRMNDKRIPKQLLYGELAIGKRPQHKPSKRFKDVVKGNLKALEVDIAHWEELAADRKIWRQEMIERCGNFESSRIEHVKLKRALRKQDESAVPADIQQELKCRECGRLLLSKAGFVNHVRSHYVRQDEQAYVDALPPRPPKFSCNICGLVCTSASGLTRHSKVHNDDVLHQHQVTGRFICHICERVCKSEAGLKSHLRAHGRAIAN